MKFHIKIETNNPAFRPYWVQEALHLIIEAIEKGCRGTHNIYNTKQEIIGTWGIECENLMTSYVNGHIRANLNEATIMPSIDDREGGVPPGDFGVK